MISNADVEDIRSRRVTCSGCGHSWLRREGAERQTCPACGDPYMEDEHRNLERKN